MDRKTYDKLTEAEVQGRRVVLVEDITNGRVTALKGTTGTIRGKRNGYKIWTDTCSTCGRRDYFTYVNPSAVELLR